MQSCPFFSTSEGLGFFREQVKLGRAGRTAQLPAVAVSAPANGLEQLLPLLLGGCLKGQCQGQLDPTLDLPFPSLFFFPGLTSVDNSN